MIEYICPICNKLYIIDYCGEECNLPLQDEYIDEDHYNERECNDCDNLLDNTSGVFEDGEDS